MSNAKDDLHVGFIGNPNCGKTTNKVKRGGNEPWLK